MPETGGPANQAGIFFQNTISALYMGRMTDLRPRARRDRVTHVRVEAPEAVDDISVRMGDNSRLFIQAKRAIDVVSDSWVRLWTQYQNQLLRASTSSDDRLVLVCGEHSRVAADLMECRRTAGVVDQNEYFERLTHAQRVLFGKISCEPWLGEKAR